jgi:uncharacterized membrane protein YcaP (DUF421 family)
MLTLSLPWWEYIVRALVVYVFLLLILRVTGKRQVGQLTPFDFILLLILSNAVQNSMSGGDNSLAGGLISAFVLILFNRWLDVLSFRWPQIGRVIEGKPEILVHDGKIYHQALKKQKISMDELHSALRKNGVLEISDVRLAMIEASGTISVISRPGTTETK